MRRRVFASIEDDGALSKLVAVPSGEPRALVELLIETLARACDYRGRAVATLAPQKGTKLHHKKAQNIEN